MFPCLILLTKEKGTIFILILWGKTKENTKYFNTKLVNYFTLNNFYQHTKLSILNECPYYYISIC